MVKSQKLIFISALIGIFFAINIFSSALNISRITNLNFSSITGAVDSISLASSNAKSLNLEEASQNFLEASQYFQDLQDNSLVFENQILSPQELSEAGLIISKVGDNLTKSLTQIQNLPLQIFDTNKQVFLNPNQVVNTDLTQNIQDLKSTIELSISQISKAQEIFSSQSYQLLPPATNQKYKLALSQLNDVHDILRRLDALLAGSLDLLGHQTPHRYLVLIQNQNELRPLGGFLGSVMSFEVNQGVIQNINFQDIYDIDGQSQKTLPVPPEFHDFTTEIFSRDANYSPLPEVSIHKIQDLLNYSKQPNYRSYIVLNHTFFAKLLELAGPLNLEIEGKTYTIDHTNFSLILNTIVEIEQNKDVVNEILETTQIHIFQNLDIQALSRIIKDSILDRDLQFYTQNQSIQSEINQAPLYSPLKTDIPNYQDYLMITETNIGGNKSDQYMDNKFTHITDFQDNKLVNTLQISKTHTYSNQIEIINNSILAQNNITSIPDELRYVLGRGDNRTRTKIYIPIGSKITGFEGDFTQTPEIYEDDDFNKSYILFETITAPGETSDVKISYEPKLKKLKYKVKTYKLILQKSSGYNYKFQKILKSSDKSTGLNTANFDTSENQVFYVQGKSLSPREDLLFQSYYYSL